MQLIQLPDFKDPDLEDIPSLVSCDFGLASTFVMGNFPNYKIAPVSNITDPGDYEIKITLTDDNPSKLTSSFTFKLTVTPLLPKVEVLTIGNSGKE